METQQHLNVDAGAQGGDNEGQTPQIGGANTAGTANVGTGENNAGETFNASSAGGLRTSDGAQEHTTKSDQNDYSAAVTNDGLANSSDNLGMTDGARGAGSVENLAVSMGDVLQGAGAGTGAAAGNQNNSS